jgi:hypothetical protein
MPRPAIQQDLGVLVGGQFGKSLFHIRVRDEGVGRIVKNHAASHKDRDAAAVGRR